MFLDPQTVIEHFNLAEGMKVADFGSGHGHFTVPVARKVGPYGRVYAIDAVSDSLDQLRHEALGEGLSHIHFIHSDLEKERGSFLADNSVHRVLAVNTMFAVENKEAVIREVLRILEPKGLFVLIDWRDSFHNIGPSTAHLFPFEKALELVLPHGFYVKKEFDAGDMHYGIIFELPSRA